MRKILRRVAARERQVPGAVRVERYKRRYWAVYDRNGLVVVTVYRKGARSVAARLQGVPARTKTWRRL